MIKHITLDNQEDGNYVYIVKDRNGIEVVWNTEEDAQRHIRAINHVSENFRPNYTKRVINPQLILKGIELAEQNMTAQGMRVLELRTMSPEEAKVDAQERKQASRLLNIQSFDSLTVCRYATENECPHQEGIVSGIPGDANIYKNLTFDHEGTPSPCFNCSRE